MSKNTTFHQKVTRFLQSKAGITFSLINSLLLLIIAIYAINRQIEHHNNIRLACGVFTLCLALTGIYTEVRRALRLRHQ